MHNSPAALQLLRDKTAIVVGGGLAGISAGLALARLGVQVRLLEARRRLGGRTGSFSSADDTQESNLVDYCQHVGMACCTNLQQLIDWLDQRDSWTRHKELHFYGADGSYHRLTALPWLPAPLHLMPWLVSWPNLTWRDRLGIARCMLIVQKIQIGPDTESLAAATWLREQGQSQTSVDHFWNTIIVSALGEDISRVNFGAVCKVLQDGFLRHRDAFHLLVPNRPLDELFHRQGMACLQSHGATIHLAAQATRLQTSAETVRVGTKSGEYSADACVLAIPWYQLARLSDSSAIPELAALAKRVSALEASPITGIHTWWDKPWLPHAHATLVGRLCQWVFAEPGWDQTPRADGPSPETYYQIVISASRQLPNGDSAMVERLIRQDLADVFPACAKSRLIRFKAVTDPKSVFSVTPGSSLLRPSANALKAPVFLAGDWTKTGWPATMEGAILSGFVAAERVLAGWGVQYRIAAEPLHTRAKAD